MITQYLESSSGSTIMFMSVSLFFFLNGSTFMLLVTFFLMLLVCTAWSDPTYVYNSCQVTLVQQTQFLLRFFLSHGKWFLFSQTVSFSTLLIHSHHILPVHQMAFHSSTRSKGSDGFAVGLCSVLSVVLLRAWPFVNTRVYFFKVKSLRACYSLNL